MLPEVKKRFRKHIKNQNLELVVLYVVRKMNTVVLELNK